MGLFSHKLETKRDAIEVFESYYEGTANKLFIHTPNDVELGKMLGFSMKKIANISHEFLIGDKSLEEILRNCDLFNRGYYKITEYKILKCEGEQLVDEVFISLRGKRNLDVRYKLQYDRPVNLIPIWYKDLDYHQEHVLNNIDPILWEVICDCHKYSNNKIDDLI